MHHDDLKMIWICGDCHRMFVFSSDIVDHTKSTGHSNVLNCDLSANPSKKGLLSDIFVYGKATLNFKIHGRRSAALLQYRYYPSKDLLHYIDVRYTNSELETMVEEDPAMMEKIDMYVRNSLRGKQLNFDKKKTGW